MFVVELIYKAPLAEIDAAMRAHMAFLRKHYADGHFLVSGRKIPRDGGVILAVGRDRAEIEALMQSDPFVARGHPPRRRPASGNPRDTQLRRVHFRPARQHVEPAPPVQQYDPRRRVAAGIPVPPALTIAAVVVALHPWW